MERWTDRSGELRADEDEQWRHGEQRGRRNRRERINKSIDR